MPHKGLKETCFQGFFGIFALAFALVFSGCSSDKDPLKGERHKLLTEARPLELDANAENINVELDSPVTNTSWTHPSNNASHLIPHGEFDHHHEILWKESVGSGSAKDRYLIAQPVVEDDLIFTMDSEGLVRARNTLSGKKMWSFQLPLKGDTDNCLGGGLAVHQGKLYASFSSADVFCLDALNGVLIWHTPVVHPIRSAPTIKNNRVYVITKQNSVIALNALTGERLWNHEGAAEMCSMLGGGTVAVDRHVVIVPYATGELFALKAENGLPLWGESLNASHSMSSTSMLAQIKTDPILDKNLVIVSSQSGRMAAIDFKTGARIWEKDIACLSTPVISSSFLFVVTATGDVLCLTKRTGEVVWQKSLSQYIPAEDAAQTHWVGPLLAGSSLYVTNSAGRVFALAPGNGDKLHEFSVPGTIYVAPILVNKIMYFLADQGRLIAVN
ncbi:MAG: PQQ-binding-like beta-propeller repeat protein [Alphaproteobacteria bacterium]